MADHQYLSSMHLGAIPHDHIVPLHERLILLELQAIYKELVQARRERFLARKAEYESACFEAHIPCDWTEVFEEELS